MISNPKIVTWQDLFTSTGNVTNRIICGDFNVHSYNWGSLHSNSKGNRISEALENCNLISINDKHPTFIPKCGEYQNNLDLFFIPTSLCDKTTYENMESSFGSNHIPIVIKYLIKPNYVTNNFTRINTCDVDWILFRQKIDILLLDLYILRKEMTPDSFLEYMI